ncbi:MAG: GAF domain-containing protein [Lachnospiraceae bacterium]|nr:GAF domain-containing protein [Lachnospiraceae bacterium]
MNYKETLERILKIGIALSAEKDSNELLNYIVKTAMDLTGCDGGTLYLLDNDALKFRIMITKSKDFKRGVNGEEIDIPPVPLKEENICAYSAIHKQALNIPDVYNSDLFDFSGPKKYDELNGYHTQSMIAVPLVNYHEEVLGVMQLINATKDGEVSPFTDDEQMILVSLASQTAIALSNMQYLNELNQQMWSFTEAMTEAIDARTPYNGSHTRKVAVYSGMIADYINELHAKGEEETFFTEEHKDQLVMAAYLHDIGKMIIPIDIMNKATRLDKHMSDVENRLAIIKLKIKVDYLEGRISEDDFKQQTSQVEDTLNIVHEVDAAGFIPDDKMAQVVSTFDYKYVDADGEETSYLTEEEKTCLQIRKGTLTAEERGIMESHVRMTDRILSKVYFNRSFKNSPVWAAQHHECIDGSGYPNKLQGEDLCMEARILAVADICDALLATDRPYKKPLPKEKAFSIMESMVEEGKLEGKYVQYLKACLDK